jgi:polyketide cyclase/dehydrase/lipid transport protein
MWFKLRKVDLGFIASAGKTSVVECDLQAARRDVWDAFVDPATWPHWWPGVKSASYGGGTRPYGVGTFRQATVGGQRYEEYIVAWDEGRRWAYYINRATLPIATAQLECTEFEDHDTGTRVRWIVAHDRRFLLWLVGPLFPRIMRSLFRKAMANLDAYLAAKQAAHDGGPRGRSCV